MTIPNVAFGDTLDVAWGNAVADELNASTSLDTTGTTAASGWSLDLVQGRRFGPCVQLLVRVERTGGTISVGNDGNITNVQIATLPAVFRGTVTAFQAMSSVNFGRVANGWYQPNDGALWLGSVSGGGDDIVNTDEIMLAGVAFVD